MNLTLRCLFGLSVILLGITSGSVHAQKMGYGKAPLPGDSGPPSPEDVRIEQKLGAMVPLDLQFTNWDGQPVTLKELVGGKPTIFVLAYYRCPKLCNAVLSDLADALKEVTKSDPSMVAGGPFNVVVLSIDPREAPTLARPARQSFLERYDGRKEDKPGIWFLTASHGQGTDVADADRKIHSVADTVGFQYTVRKRGRDNDYQHASGIMFLSPEGKVTRYILGLNYAPEEVRSAITEAAGGQVGSFSDKVSQFCFVYDEVKGHYRPTMRLLAVVSAPFVLIVGFLAIRTARRAAREQALQVPREPRGDSTTS